MRALFYTVFLLAVLVACVLMLRSISPPASHAPRPAEAPRVSSAGADPSEFDTASVADASPLELADMGSELLELWHVREATAALERAVEADSTLYMAWVRLVECYTDPQIAGEDAARVAWRHAAATVPASEDSFFLAGIRNLYIENDYTAAVGDLTAALRFEVSHPRARYYLALSYYFSGRLDDLDGQLEVLLGEDDTDGRALALSVRRLAASGDYDAAGDRARQLARTYSEEPYPYVLLAQTELLSGDVPQAVDFCNNALNLDARYVPAVLSRATIYAMSGDFAAARVGFEKLLMFDDHVLRSLAHEGIAFVDFLTGAFEDGVDEMDESIRYAMLAGSVRRGLAMSTRLVAYLCELGQPDRAEGVIDRWVAGFGEIPENLAGARLLILSGDVSRARNVLTHVQASKEWLVWSRSLGLDTIELNALAQIAAHEPEKALTTLDDGPSRAGVAAGVSARRSFYRGYASFEAGDAEAAGTAFGVVPQQFFSTEIPYRGDPVLYVQSYFFVAESALARGDEDTARTNYEKFLGRWADASWELPAVARAQSKLEALGASTTP